MSTIDNKELKLYANRKLEEVADNIRRASEEIIFLLELVPDIITDEEKSTSLINATDVLELNVKEFRKHLTV